ncbi:MAG: 30S ribosome-binding factor RbfA [Synergistaceae bacterium]|nr:30S ribosome-binding factor RbfA [Synergistaceae bacterium]
MATYRIDRINKEFLRLISEMLQTRIKRAEAAEAVLTKVSVARDLNYAKVFYTIIKEENREKVQAVLDSAAGPIRSMLGKEMHLRTIPELHFCYDDSENRARAMDELLDKVAELDAQKRAERDARQ